MKQFGIVQCLLAAIVVALAGTAQAAEVRRAPPPDASSPIWLDPALPGSGDEAALRRAGYVREEWFQAGTANVYGDGLAIVRRDVPYVTRLIVIRPRDPRRFSGTVQLNPAHPYQGNFNWPTIAPYVLERGDAFVAVMIGADDNTRRAKPGPVPVMAPLTLRWFHPARYAAIQWPADEDGIRWDVFTDTARLLRDPTGPLPGLAVRRTFASGWSFTGSFLRTYINEGFHDRARTAAGKPLIDGYLLGISGFSFRSGYLALNSALPVPGIDDPRRPNRPIDVPVIELQSENEAITNRDPQTPDRDPGPGAHRLYELPGTTHGSGGARTFLAERQIAGRLGQPFAPPMDSCPYPPSDIDIAAFARAALANLERWVERRAAAAARRAAAASRARPDARRERQYPGRYSPGTDQRAARAIWQSAGGIAVRPRSTRDRQSGPFDAPRAAIARTIAPALSRRRDRLSAPLRCGGGCAGQERLAARTRSAKPEGGRETAGGSRSLLAVEDAVHPVERGVEHRALLGVELRQHFGLDVDHDREQLVERLGPARKDRQRMAAAIDSRTLALGPAALFELVDDLHGDRLVEADRARQFLLGNSRIGLDQGERGEQARADVVVAGRRGEEGGQLVLDPAHPEADVIAEPAELQAGGIVAIDRSCRRGSDTRLFNCFHEKTLLTDG